MQLLEQAQTLLNFDGQSPFDVNILDAVVNTMYRGQGDAVSCAAVCRRAPIRFVLCLAATAGERSLERLARPSGRVDQGRQYLGVFQMPGNEVLRLANSGKDDQNALESSTEGTMRG